MDAKILISASKLSELRDSDLFDLALAEIEGPSFRKGSEGEDEKRSRVEKWISDHWVHFQASLCNDEVVVLLDPPETVKEKVLIIAAVADCIAGAVTGISPVTASALIVNYGIRKLCRG
jgi:hypothetical protein